MLKSVACVSCKARPCRTMCSCGCNQAFCSVECAERRGWNSATGVHELPSVGAKFDGDQPSKDEYRLIPETDNVIELGEIFCENNEQFGETYNTTAQKPDHAFRIMTYNVHMWQGVVGKSGEWSNPGCNNSENIIANIRELDPDVLCLQEVSYFEPAMARLYATHELLTACAINPTVTRNRPYMTMVCLKNGLRERLAFYAAKMGDARFSAICSSEPHCFLGQEAYIFKPPDAAKVYARDREEKCFVRFSLPSFDVVAVHLTAYDLTGKTRIRELDAIDAAIDVGRPTLMLGDFNMLNAEEYTSANEFDGGTRFQEYIAKYRSTYGLTGVEYEHAVKDLGWEDVFLETQLKEELFMNYSNWTGFRVDHIFAKNWSREQKSGILQTLMYYSSASDHNPLLLDLSETFVMPFKPTSPHVRNRPLHWTNACLGDWFEDAADVVFPAVDFFEKFERGAARHVAVSPGDTGNIVLFNVQPLAGINWFDLGKIAPRPRNYACARNAFHDPYHTGTDETDLTLGGTDGIYLSTHPANLLTILIKSIQGAFSRRLSHPSDFNQDLFLLFVFSLDIRTPDLMVRRLRQPLVADFAKDRKKYYVAYDVLVVHNYPVPPYVKVTTRSNDGLCSKILRLEAIYLCSGDSNVFTPEKMWAEFVRFSTKCFPVDIPAQVKPTTTLFFVEGLSHDKFALTPIWHAS